jgi:ParB-like chromosome segregation protein Spo0J
MSRLEPHPLSAMFPPITEDDFNKLIADIKANGLLQPITLSEGKILDGNNRYRACLLAKIEPMIVNFGGPDALAFVISQNIHRRHLTPDQRREIIAALLKADPTKSNRQRPQALLEEVKSEHA